MQMDTKDKCKYYWFGFYEIFYQLREKDLLVVGSDPKRYRKLDKLGKT